MVPGSEASIFEKVHYYSKKKPVHTKNIKFQNENNILRYEY